MREQQLQIVNYEQAKKLKELGFDWIVQTTYNKNTDVLNFEWNNYNDSNNYSGTCWTMLTSAPTVALALKWFRDVKGKIGIVEYRKEKDDWTEGGYHYHFSLIDMPQEIIMCKTYESAESALLDALIEHCLTGMGEES